MAKGHRHLMLLPVSDIHGGDRKNKGALSPDATACVKHVRGDGKVQEEGTVTLHVTLHLLKILLHSGFTHPCIACYK